MVSFMNKMTLLNSDLFVYAEQLEKTKNIKELANFSPLISFLKQYYYEELAQQQDELKKKMPFKQDQVAFLKRHHFD